MNHSDDPAFPFYASRQPNFDKTKGPEPFQAPALYLIAQAAIESIATHQNCAENQAVSLALTWSTMAPKAALSLMAISERTLRSISIPAFFSPLANWL
jgi:hypothetical protein